MDEKAKEVLQSESPAEHCDYWDVVRSSTQYILHTFYIQLVLECEISLSPASILAFAGCELHLAGQVGRGQTDADEARGSTSRSEEHVQADGQSAQQNAILHCMIFNFYLSVSAADNICLPIGSKVTLFCMKKPKYESLEIVYRPIIMLV